MESADLYDYARDKFLKASAFLNLPKKEQKGADDIVTGLNRVIMNTLHSELNKKFKSKIELEKLKREHKTYFDKLLNLCKNHNINIPVNKEIRKIKKH